MGGLAGGLLGRGIGMTAEVLVDRCECACMDRECAEEATPAGTFLGGLGGATGGAVLANIWDEQHEQQASE